jgi:hypothetical protein
MKAGRMNEAPPATAEAACIGCGCTDSRACPGGCRWVWVDRVAGTGWCSSCDAGSLDG